MSFRRSKKGFEWDERGDSDKPSSQAVDEFERRTG